MAVGLIVYLAPQLRPSLSQVATGLSLSRPFRKPQMDQQQNRHLFPRPMCQGAKTSPAKAATRRNCSHQITLDAWLPALLSNSRAYKLDQHSKTFQNIPKNSKTFQKIPKNSKKFQKIPKNSFLDCIFFSIFLSKKEKVGKEMLPFFPFSK